MLEISGLFLQGERRKERKLSTPEKRFTERKINTSLDFVVFI